MRMRVVLLTLSVIAVLLATFSAWQITFNTQLQNLKDQATDSLSLKSSSVMAEIERYRYLPVVLGQDQRIQRLLDANDTPDAVDLANRYLETVNGSAKSSALFVLNDSGVALASSNWQEATSFVGERYDFRPYFTDAIAAGEGHYYAVGVTSGVPGYFLARRIRTSAGAVGVVVVKVDMFVLEKTWLIAGEHVGLVDSAGIVFLSSVPDWKYRPLFPLSESDRKRIAGAHQYPKEALTRPPLLQSSPSPEQDIYTQVQGNTMLLRLFPIAGTDWRILAAYDVAPVHLTAHLVAALVFLAGALSLIPGLYLLERRQRSRADQLREILENMSAGIAVFDSGLRLIAWNSKYGRLNSYPDSFVSVGRPYAEIISYNIARGDYGPGDPKKQLQERLDRVRQQAFRQTEVKRPDGTWVGIMRSRMPNGTFIMTYTDITERKQAEVELDAHRNNLEGLVAERTAELSQVNERLHEAMEQMEIEKGRAVQADRAKTTFLNSVSHDIRNPLNAILGYAGLVLSNAKNSLPERQYQNLSKLAAKGRELNDLVNDFLDYTRADHVNTAKFELAQLIHECVVTVEPMIDGKHVQIRCDVPDDLPTMVQDARKLRRVIHNLLNNAAKFTEKGTIQVSARQQGDSMEILVSDTGIGIPEEFMRRIFEEFERAEPRGERPREGTGLGLAICRRFATLMDGDVTVQSKPGEGSVFRLSIPIIHRKVALTGQAPEPKDSFADPVSHRESAMPTSLNGQATVLIVDDSRENRDFLAQLLEKRYRVLVAGDGRKAIEVARARRPDVILMDLSLPLMDGWQATRLIKADPDLRSIPIIAITAHATKQNKEEVEAAGCDHFLAKPVDERALLDTLRHYVGVGAPVA